MVTTRNILTLQRNASNKVCLQLLLEHLEEYPDLRLEQVLWRLDEGQDFFNEEPDNTYKRWKEKLNK